MLDAIIVIAQYARDQAMVAHVTKQLKYRCAVWIGEHTPGICLESSKNGKLV